MKFNLEGVTISFDHNKQSAVPIKYEGDPDKIDEIKWRLETEGTARFSHSLNADKAFASDFMLAIACVYRVQYDYPPGVTSFFNPPGEPGPLGVN